MKHELYTFVILDTELCLPDHNYSTEKSENQHNIMASDVRYSFLRDDNTYDDKDEGVCQISQHLPEAMEKGLYFRAYTCPITAEHDPKYHNSQYARHLKEHFTCTDGSMWPRY